VHLAIDLNNLKSLPNYLAVGRFSNPPQLSDLSGFELDADDINDLKKCRPGNCEIQLPEGNIEQFKSQIDWLGADVAGQVNNLAKKMALEALLAYQTGGNAALGTYRDKKSPAQLASSSAPCCPARKFCRRGFRRFIPICSITPRLLFPTAPPFSTGKK